MTDSSDAPRGKPLRHGDEPAPLHVTTYGNGPALIYVTDDGTPVRLDTDDRDHGDRLATNQPVKGLPARDWQIIRALAQHAFPWERY